MAELVNKTHGQLLLSNCKVASGFVDRARGLLGTDHLDLESALWILRCNSIHTFGMRYSIACVFLNKSMKVISVLPEVKPWRLVWPIWKSSSVIELKANHPILEKIKPGDTLNVGS